ncbi:hypothetical protein [Sediminicola luteus]|uniref:Glyoxalase n=1 Tax=Sediminicola luteus TaxID=319238 RepID=A0ABV2TRS5_9FLAO
MDKEDLLGKELSNLYAIYKQVNHFFDGSDISFLNERRQQIVMNYVKLSCKNEEAVAEVLRKAHINPGNTIDSVVNEITDNLHKITLQKKENKKLEGLGYMMSFNRLVSYHEANVKNIEFILNELGQLKTSR